MLPGEHGSEMFWIDPELLSGIPESQRVAKLAGILEDKDRKKSDGSASPADLRRFGK